MKQTNEILEHPDFLLLRNVFGAWKSLLLTSSKKRKRLRLLEIQQRELSKMRKEELRYLIQKVVFESWQSYVRCQKNERASAARDASLREAMAERSRLKSKSRSFRQSDAFTPQDKPKDAPLQHEKESPSALQQIQATSTPQDPENRTTILLSFQQQKELSRPQSQQKNMHRPWFSKPKRDATRPYDQQQDTSMTSPIHYQKGAPVYQNRWCKSSFSKQQCKVPPSEKEQKETTVLQHPLPLDTPKSANRQDDTQQATSMASPIRCRKGMPVSQNQWCGSSFSQQQYKAFSGWIQQLEHDLHEQLKQEMSTLESTHTLQVNAYLKKKFNYNGLNKDLINRAQEQLGQFSGCTKASYGDMQPEERPKFAAIDKPTKSKNAYEKEGSATVQSQLQNRPEPPPKNASRLTQIQDHTKRSPRLELVQLRSANAPHDVLQLRPNSCGSIQSHRPLAERVISHNLWFNNESAQPQPHPDPSLAGRFVSHNNLLTWKTVSKVL